MSKLAGIGISSLLAAIVILALGYSHVQQLEAKLDTAKAISADFESASANARASLIKAERDIRAGFVEELTTQAQTKGNEVRGQLLEKLKAEHNELLSLIEAEKAKLQKLHDDNERKKRGLPKLVELDDLKKKYAQISGSSYGHAVTFQTDNGPIVFSHSNISMFFIPSSRELARIRIGKTATTENSELIKTWIVDSREAKKKLGYKLIYKRTKPSDYGEYTEVLMKKGDLYFKTYFQHERVLETYGRHSLQYTYYVETGSSSRLERAKLEQANAALGS